MLVFVPLLEVTGRMNVRLPHLNQVVKCDPRLLLVCACTMAVFVVAVAFASW
jgi:hypothetical protein